MTLPKPDEMGQYLCAMVQKDMPEELVRKFGMQAIGEVCFTLGPKVSGLISLGVVEFANVLARRGPDEAKKYIERCGGRVSDASLDALRGRMKVVEKVKPSSFLEALDELNCEGK